MDISKQAVHQRRQRSSSYGEEQAYLVDLIRHIRRDHPTISCQSLYYMINPVSMGRDKFVRLCMDHGFRSAPPMNPRRTTDSSGVVRFPNLVKDVQITGIDQVWSSDITYFDVGGVFYYLTFITDNYSRRILGWNVSGRLNTENTTFPALKKAIKQRGGRIKAGVILHSDGGGQYYDHNFVDYSSRKLKMRNSMCEYAWENGLAERVNGVIKNNYLRHWSITNLEELVRQVDRAVTLYNEEKPHKGLKFRSPVAFEKNHYTSPYSRPKRGSGMETKTARSQQQHIQQTQQ